MFLPVPEQATHEDNPQNNEGIGRISQKDGHTSGRQKNGNDRTLKLRQEETHFSKTALSSQVVATALKETQLRFLPRQTLGRCIKLLQ